MAVSPELVRLYRRATLVLLVLYWVALFIATHMPLPPKTLPGNTDKLAHFVAYGGLSALFGLFLLARWEANRKLLAVSFLVPALFAVVDELLQIPVGRTCDLRDMVADWIGAALGTLLIWLLVRPLLSQMTSENHSGNGAS